LRITIIGPVYPYRGGIAHYTTALARRLADRGHPVEVLSFKRQYPGWLYPGASDRDPSLEAPQVAAEFLLDPFYPWTWRQSLQHIHRFQPDRVLVNWWTTFWGLGLGYLANRLRRTGRPVQFLIHNVIPHEQKPWDRPLTLLVLRQSSDHITFSEREARRLQALIPGAQSQVCPLPVLDLLNQPKVSAEAARRQLGLPLKPPVVLAFGIVRPYKGLQHLLQALAQPILAAKKVHLLVAGEFWEDRREYEAQIQQLGLADRVSLLDRYISNEELPVIFSAADLLAAPYVGGTQSGAIQLAAAYGLPMVVSPSIAVHQAAGPLAERMRTADPLDPPALAAAIDALLTQPPARGSLEQMDANQSWEPLLAAIERPGGR
jgi:glycosyltransferase involved in cell wall biosynthesis